MVFSAKRWKKGRASPICDFFSLRSSGWVLGIESWPPGCFGCKVTGLHNVACTPSTLEIQSCKFKRYCLPTSSLLGSIPGHHEVTLSFFNEKMPSRIGSVCLCASAVVPRFKETFRIPFFEVIFPSVILLL